MATVEKPKATSFEYGESYQNNQLEKYHNRDSNHWRFRVELAHRLVDEHCLPRLRDKSAGEIVVVDVGCSIGTFAIEFAKAGFRAYGIDFDRHALELAEQLAREEGATATFLHGDVAEWTAHSEPIDIAICFDLFEHLHDDELGALLQSLRRQLSPQGTLVFHTYPTQYIYLILNRWVKRVMGPIRSLPPAQFDRVLRAIASLYDFASIVRTNTTRQDRIKMEGHCNPTTMDRLSDILARAGYDIVHIEYAQLYPQNSRYLQQFLHQPLSHQNLFGVAVPRASATH